MSPDADAGTSILVGCWFVVVAGVVVVVVLASLVLASIVVTAIVVAGTSPISQFVPAKPAMHVQLAVYVLSACTQVQSLSKYLPFPLTL